MNLLALNPGGAIPTVAGTPTDFNGGTPVLLQKLCVDSSVGGVFVAGLQFTQDGRLCISVGGVPRMWVAGLPLGVNGRLCCSVLQPILFYQQGVPIDAAGRVVLQNNPVTLQTGVDDIDADDKPDTVLLDTPGGGPDVTIDADSINIDADGDGVAETVIPIP